MTRQLAEAEVEKRILLALDDVASLDHDRILRSYLTHIRATLRTNYFQPARTRTAAAPLHLAQARAVRDPRPARAAADVRDLRLLAAGRGRAPALRRGGPRRPALVGPTRRLPHRGARPGQGADGEEHRDRAGRRQGRLLLQAAARPERPRRVAGRGRRLLHDLHLRAARHHRQPASTARRCRRSDVVRHDGDDSYLVVAADKGTATFSDIANGVAKDYGFWLGDAFASRRLGRLRPQGDGHHRPRRLGLGAAALPRARHRLPDRGLHRVGIGDMSGDVFGNGMLCSEHIRLVAAFDHRDIFLDPTPDAGDVVRRAASGSSSCRARAGRTTTRSLISEGGGVFPRSLKSIPLDRRRSATALGIDGDVDAMTPAELMKAILQAPVDLLWNGGIGTYVKASRRDPRRRRRQGQRRDPGQRRRAAGQVRRRGRQPRAAPSAAGSSTPRAGGRINTDFIDNSAGVDTSDHEVNIKILLDRVVADGDLTGKQRNALLAEMTDEVADAGAARQLRAEPRAGQRRRPRARRCCTSTRTG